MGFVGVVGLPTKESNSCGWHSSTLSWIWMQQDTQLRQDTQQQQDSLHSNSRIHSSSMIHSNTIGRYKKHPD